MQIVAQYSFNNGLTFLEDHYASELDEIKDVISSVVGARLKTKISKEKTMPGRALYSPKALNKEFRRLFENEGWRTGKFVRIEVKTFVPEISKEHKGFSAGATHTYPPPPPLIFLLSLFQAVFQEQKFF